MRMPWSRQDRRARACVRACIGLSTEALEAGVVKNMLIALIHINQAMRHLAANGPDDPGAVDAVREAGKETVTIIHRAGYGFGMGPQGEA